MFNIEIWNGEFNELFNVDAEPEIIFHGTMLTTISFNRRRDSERLSLEGTRDLISDFRQAFSRLTKTEEKLLKDYQDIPTDSSKQASLSAIEHAKENNYYKEVVDKDVLDTDAARYE